MRIREEALCSGVASGGRPCMTAFARDHDVAAGAQSTVLAQDLMRRPFQIWRSDHIGRFFLGSSNESCAILCSANVSILTFSRIERQGMKTRTAVEVSVLGTDSGRRMTRERQLCKAQLHTLKVSWHLPDGGKRRSTMKTYCTREETSPRTSDNNNIG